MKSTQGMLDGKEVEIQPLPWSYSLETIPVGLYEGPGVFVRVDHNPDLPDGCETSRLRGDGCRVIRVLVPIELQRAAEAAGDSTR